MKSIHQQKQAITPGLYDLEQALRALPRCAPPFGLAERIMAALPAGHGRLGHWQYLLCRPRHLPTATLASLLLLAGLFHLLLAALLFHLLPPIDPLFPPSTWLALQPPLLAMMAVPPLLAAFQLRRRRSPSSPVIVAYFPVMAANALYPLIIQPNLFLGLAALGLLLPPLLLGLLLALGQTTPGNAENPI